MEIDNQTSEKLINYLLDRITKLEKELKETNDMLFKTEDALRIATHNNTALTKEIKELKG